MKLFTNRGSSFGTNWSAILQMSRCYALGECCKIESWIQDTSFPNCTWLPKTSTLSPMRHHRSICHQESASCIHPESTVPGISALRQMHQKDDRVDHPESHEDVALQQQLTEDLPLIRRDIPCSESWWVQCSFCTFGRAYRLSASVFGLFARIGTFHCWYLWVPVICS